MDLIAEPQAPYRVLARTYRPTRLSELIGQEPVVRTLTNALRSGRIAHAFLLSGIRGVGKTTTARIIARALNCTGADGKGGPTPEPCGQCPSCQAIGDDRPMDVIEMDAATRTGIDDIREIVDAVRYAPAVSRYKIYIIDEVHMLSEKAFNGLLKTLEEPPPHAKFIFATTEVRKLPLTVLSRCQRFDLRRVDIETLKAHLASICAREKMEAEDEALALIARAAEGSVRDSLSLLDQAIALSEGPVATATVEGMIGLGDRRRLIDLFDALMAGEAARALDIFRELIALGAEPQAVVQDLLEISHWLSCFKAERDAVSYFALPPDLLDRGRKMAEALDLAILSRAWQLLLKGLDEVRLAPDATAAAEMILLRLVAMGDLPPPGELAKLLRQGEAGAPASQPSPSPAKAPTGPAPISSAAPAAARPTTPAPAEPAGRPTSFAGLVDLLSREREKMLAALLHQGAHLVAFAPPELEIRLGPGMPGDLKKRLEAALRRITGEVWQVRLSEAEGEPTLAEQEGSAKSERMAALAEDPAIRQVMEAFPGARLVDIRRDAT